MPKHPGVRSRIASGAAGAAGVVALAWSSGGYFPSEWGLITLVLLLFTLAAVVLADRIALGGPTLVLLCGLTALGAWQLVSLLWSGSAGLPVAEAERTLLYLAAAVALLLCLSPLTVPALLEGITVGITIVALYALGTRLAPGTLGGAYDPSSGYQLAKPLGYWNALGLLLVFGLLLAAGVALQKDAVRSPLAAAVAVPLVACLYFTFSRGSLAALGAGLVVLVVLGRDRLRVVLLLGVFLVVPLTGVLLARDSVALTTAGATLETAQREGHRLAWQLALLAGLAAAFDVAAGWAVARVTLGRSVRRTLAATAAALLLLVLVGGLVTVGGPGEVIDRARAAFVEEPPPTENGLDRRLLSASGNGRAAYWRVAVDMVGREPLLGGGAGSFTRVWVAERPVANEARDAHNLYLETVAELGPVGLVALLLVLAAPFLSLRRAWRDPSAPAAAAVLIAFVLHSAVDWDWEIPLLTLVALSCSGAILVLEPQRRGIELPAARRASALAVVGVAITAALVMHVGNRAVAEALDALAADEPERAAAAAGRAGRWLPWSIDGDQLLGEALLEQGDDEPARVVLRRAAERDSGDWSIWYDLATVTTGAERVRALTRARELNPLSVEISALEAETRTDSS